jgi:hypothetical protein
MAIKFVDDQGSWAALADFASDLGHADWRDEVLSMLDTYGPGAFGPPVDRPEPAVTALRPAV